MVVLCRTLWRFRSERCFFAAAMLAAALLRAGSDGAAAIRSSIRQGDIFGRLGREELALVLPKVGLREAAMVTERLRRSVANLVVVLESGGLQRVTVGVAFSASAVPDLVEMVSLADRAMYDARNAGRDRVEVRDYPAASAGR